MAKFQIGDKVRCVKFTRFSDGSYHSVGQTEEVTEKTVAYYNDKNNRNNYEPTSTHSCSCNPVEERFSQLVNPWG